MNNTREVLLEIQQLVKFFDKGDKSTHVLKDINLKVQTGECVGIVGESGSGKSTLARLLCRIYSQDSGQVLFRGEAISAINPMDYYQQVQMVFQDPLSSFPPRMKVKRYLLEPFKNFKRLKGINPDAHAKALLFKVGLSEELLDRYPNQLSGGQLQRIVFARATGIHPALLICDEATCALDATIQKQVLSVFDELRNEIGFACIFITHDLALAEALCESIHVLDDGRIVETLTSGNLIKEANHPTTRRLIESSCAMSEAVTLAGESKACLESA